MLLNKSKGKYLTDTVTESDRGRSTNDFAILHNRFATMTVFFTIWLNLQISAHPRHFAFLFLLGARSSWLNT